MPKEKESTGELLAKVNEEGEVAFSVEDILRGLLEKYEDTPEIHIYHGKPEDCFTLRITVYTSDAQSIEEYPRKHPSNVYIETDGQRVEEYPLEVMLTCEGVGKMEGTEGTTAYREYDVGGRESRSLDEGISRLKKKLSGTCPDCGRDVEKSYRHYPCGENMNTPSGGGDYDE